MEHFMHLKEKPFQKIWDGKKTIELRLYDEKRRNIKVGDKIEFENFVNPEQHIVANVVALHIFDSFEQLYSALPLEKCGYNPSEVRKASAKDMNLYYSPEEQSRYGVVGIEFELEDRCSAAISVAKF